jgi:zinc protease
MQSTLKKLIAASLTVLASMANVAQAGIPIEHWTTPGGAQVYLVSNPAIPMVDVQIDFDAGTRRDPQDKPGQASIMAALASKGVAAVGGQPALDENALSDAWADLGAGFGASAGTDRLSFSLRSVTVGDTLPKALALAARQLAAPSFPADIWRRERRRMEADWKEANTKPGTLAAREFARRVYGEHPYGRESTPEVWARIDVDELRTRYRQSVLPCRAKITIVGAVDRAGANDLVQRLFALIDSEGSVLKGQDCAAQARALQATTVAEVTALTQADEAQVPFESAQAHVLLGQPGFKRNDPDFFALIVGNHILGGGGFTSRLTEQVREKRGLSYSVYSYFSPGLHAGAFTIGLQTKPSQAAQAVKISREVLAEFVKNGPTEKELKAAKDNLIGGFALRIDTNRKLLDNVSNIAWNGLPLNYLDTWTQQVGKLSVADIRAAFQRKLQPERMVTVVVGGEKP